MTESEALHTAARRYCTERMAELQHQPPVGGRGPVPVHYSRRLLQCLLEEIERHLPGEYAGLDATRRELTAIALSVNVKFSEQPNPLAVRVIQQERELFCAHINGLGAGALVRVVPLPFHRTLREDESRALWMRVNERWGAGGSYWFPLVQFDEMPSDLIAFRLENLSTEIGIPRLRELLASRGVRRLYELNVEGFRQHFGAPARHGTQPEYEMDLSLFEPRGQGERYWTDDETEWLIYLSHENTVTFAGEGLITSLKNLWPTWEKRWHVPETAILV